MDKQWFRLQRICKFRLVLIDHDDIVTTSCQMEKDSPCCTKETCPVFKDLVVPESPVVSLDSIGKKFKELSGKGPYPFRALKFHFGREELRVSSYVYGDCYHIYFKKKEER